MLFLQQYLTQITCFMFHNNYSKALDMSSGEVPPTNREKPREVKDLLGSAAVCLIDSWHSSLKFIKLYTIYQ